MNAIQDDLTTCIEDRRKVVRRCKYKGDQLNIAAHRGWIDMADELLEEGTDIEHHRGSEGLMLRPLHMAASSGATEMVKFLVSRGADIEAKTEWGSTALGEAIENRMMETAQALIDLGASKWGSRTIRLPIVTIADMRQGRF